jgi:hypothetical protein
MLELQLSRTWSVRNATLRSSDGSVQYYIDTPYSWGLKTTKIKRWDGPKRELVATIDWKFDQLPIVHFTRHQIESDSFLKQGRFHNSAYEMLSHR